VPLFCPPPPFVTFGAVRFWFWFVVVVGVVGEFVGVGTGGGTCGAEGVTLGAVAGLGAPGGCGVLVCAIALAPPSNPKISPKVGTSFDPGTSVLRHHNFFDIIAMLPTRSRAANRCCPLAELHRNPATAPGRNIVPRRWYPPDMHGRILKPAFTLIELLIVIAIIATLIGILLPALGAARKTARAAVCLNSQRQTAVGMHTYAGDQKEIVIPSYNMADVTGISPCDGWAPILDRDGYISGGIQTKSTVFYCPETIDVEGMATGQTASDPLLPKGWMDWPNMRTGSKNSPVLIPQRGFNRIIRVSYWINANNPIGSAVPTIVDDEFFTGSVGYGPAVDGKYIKYTRFSAFKRPSSLIATADGVYAGRQRDNKLYSLQNGEMKLTPNNRIGYRHTGAGGGAANVAFADGHASVVTARDFPRGMPSTKTDTVNIAAAQEENSYGKPTVYADPDKSLEVK